MSRATFCDACGKQVIGKRLIYRITSQAEQADGGYAGNSAPMYRVEVCADCHTKISATAQEWIRKQNRGIDK